MRLGVYAIVLLAGSSLSACSWWHRDTTAEPAPPGADLSLKQDVDWARRAQLRQRAEAGDTEAQYQLGIARCCGFGPGRTEPKARRWLCRAAIHGHRDAQYELGRTYGQQMAKARPFSLSQFIVYAHYWYSLAAAQGHGPAAAYRDKLERDMTPRQIARSRAWQAQGTGPRCS